jgi:hypothetical protein
MRGPRVENFRHRRVDVDVTSVWPIAHCCHLADPTRTNRTAFGDIEEQPPRKPSGDLTQCWISCARQISEESEHCIGILVHSLFDSSLIEFSDFRRHLLELRMS